MLSQRELEVLIVLATGATNKEIGKKLFISISTVKTHIINIYTKLQVSNRVEAIKKALEHGLIT
ncbi:DNA-binding response regulator [Bacillus pseudomycoides]|uniref:DNA-binding response regulator n=1 Tax=Bacillus pseudomycoides TaxID=64104 RepID=A0AAJ1Z3P8_9BACI|nr:MULTISPECIES: response regulator transcription factor [Bacillus]MDR4186079.1 response regulator transcription factor [Bacillus pseudomycoides]MDR4326812.1 response regulator transcription factor [Bacillus pseudomycoides]MDR4914343.1 response regulator transcription factor [Bacillus pseudomycoides]MED0855093.1 response regulator transcription factor [Bacillus pseudomycoides]MED1539040.1 response regulator transcription factor [Bacillus pseudomycoides]